MTEAHYPGSGFVVHEWGTHTVVVGSDGSLQRGLHHEEEDLPDFVHDRLKTDPTLMQTSVSVKMETPVTYFYSDAPLTVSASVRFPQGILTQWYPNVVAFAPQVAAAGALGAALPSALGDPAFDLSFPFRTPECANKFSTVSGGALNWGSFELVPRDATGPDLPNAPIEAFNWSYARDVAANALHFPSGEAEKYLFYRGLGEFELPALVRAEAGGKLSLTNSYSEALGSVFVLNVTPEQGAFVEHGAGVASGETLATSAPDLASAAALDGYADALGGAVTAALDRTGLYHDEAVAMVNTWKRQWFKTPGVRLLYLIPQSWTEQSLPLAIDPAPQTVVRVMMIRVEVIPPELEAADVSAVKELAANPEAARAHFLALGRFAEPRLRRALALEASAAGEAFAASLSATRAAPSRLE